MFLLISTLGFTNEKPLQIKVLTIFDETSNMTANREDPKSAQYLAFVSAIRTLRSDVWFDMTGLWNENQRLPNIHVILDVFYENLSNYCINKKSASTFFISAPNYEQQAYVEQFFKKAKSFGHEKPKFETCVEFVDTSFVELKSQNKAFIFDRRTESALTPFALAVLRKKWDDIQPWVHPLDSNSRYAGFGIDFEIDPPSNYYSNDHPELVQRNAQSLLEYTKQPEIINDGLVILAGQSRSIGYDWYRLDFDPPFEGPGYFIALSALRTLEKLIETPTE